MLGRVSTGTTLILGAAWLCSLLGCTGPAFGPGNPDYPVLNRDPRSSLPITGHVPEGWIVTLFTNYDPAQDRVNDPKTGTPICARDTGPGASTPYHLSVDLPLSWQGSKFTSTVNFDRFEEGRCGWHFNGLEARVQQRPGAPVSFAGLTLGLAGQYSLPTQAHPAAPHQVDVWCYFDKHASALECHLAAWLPSTQFLAIPVAQRGNPEERLIAPGASSLIAIIHDLDSEATAYSRSLPSQ